MAGLAQELDHQMSLIEGCAGPIDDHADAALGQAVGPGGRGVVADVLIDEARVTLQSPGELHDLLGPAALARPVGVACP